MDLEVCVITDFIYRKINAAGLFSLLNDVYSTSGMMSEDLDEKFASSENVSDYFENIASVPGGFTLIAEVGNEVAGYISLCPRRQSKLRHTADLNMGVRNDYRRKGIGKKLVEAALQKAAREGIVEIVYLMVRADNHPAIKLYKNSGFEKMAVLERDTKISGHYYDGLLMRRFV